MDKNIRAFTILELLCVIAIIILLVALLVPSLSRSKMMATRTICGSNMRFYGTLGTLYLHDSNGKFPNPNQWLYSYDADIAGHPIGCRWHDLAMSPNGNTMAQTKAYQGQMWQYLAESRILLCPNFRDIALKRGCENPEHIKAIDVIPQYNYTMNGYLGSMRDGGVLNVSEIRGYEDSSSSSVSSIPSSISYEESKPTGPAAIFFFAEENCWSVRPDHSKYPARWLKNPLSTKSLDDTALLILPTPEAENCFATFHGDTSSDNSNGSGNAVFVDGHVDTITVQQQFRRTMHAANYKESSRPRSYGACHYDPAGNLRYAWASDSSPPGGWDEQ